MPSLQSSTVQPSQRRKPGNVLDTFVLITKCLKEIAGCAPHIGLQAVAGIALVILETAQGVVANQDECILLAERIGRIVLSVESAVQKLGPSSARTSLDAKVETFTRLLQSVQEFVENQRNTKWMRRIAGQQEVKAAIAGYHRNLDDICTMFEIGTLIDIHHILSEFVLSQVAVQGQGSQVPDSVEIQMEANFRLFARSDILLQRCLPRSTPSAELFEGEADGKTVIVKRFRGLKDIAVKEFLRQLELWRKLWHPNLSQLIGYSKQHDPPFIVLSPGGTRNVLMFMSSQLRQDPIRSHVVGLRLIKNIVTALLHIEENATLMDISPDFLDASNLSLNSFGEVVVGDLSFRDSKLMSKEDYYRTLLSEYRKLCREVLYGKDMFLHFCPPLRLDAPGAHINASYIGRLLTTLYAMDSGPTAALEKINQVLQILPVYENAIMDPQLMIDVHMTLLEQGFTLNSFSHSFHVNIDKQRQFQLGDIGYLCGSINDPYFVTLCNVHELLGPVVDASCYLDSEEETNSTNEVRCIWRNQCYAGTSLAFRSMLSNMCIIAKKYDVFPDQLIMITGITERPLSRFIEADPNTPPSVQTRLDDIDAAQFSEYVCTQANSNLATDDDEIPYEIAQKRLRLRQRLEWVHLGKYQCVVPAWLEVSAPASAEADSDIECRFPGSFLEEWMT